MHGLSFFCIFTNIFEPTWATIIAIFNFHEKKNHRKVLKVMIAVQPRKKRKIKRFSTRKKLESMFTLAFYDGCDKDLFGFNISFQSFAYFFTLFSIRR